MRRAAGALALVALLVLAGVLAWQVRPDAAGQRAEREALAAAQDAARAALSYDHRTLEQDVAAAEELATGTFLEEYRASTADLAEQARAGEAVVTAEVHAASVVSSSRTRVVVLLFVDQTTSRKDRDSPRVDQSRLRLEMRPVGGEWRVASLQSL